MAASNIGTDFDSVSLEAWRDQVLASLKGSDWSTLVSTTQDGISLQPLYGAADGAPISARPAAAAWNIVAAADHRDPKTANRQILTDLDAGASAVSIAFAHAPSAGGYGLPAQADTLAELLQDVYLDLVHLRIEPHPLGRRSAGWLAELFESRSTEPVRSTVSFGLDPIGNFARWGALAVDDATIAKRLAETVADLKAKGFSGQFAEADGRTYHAAGASDAQELAVALATAVHYLRVFTATGGGDADTAFGDIGVTLAVDQHQLTSIAKVRAMRLLWQRLQELCGLSGSQLRLHAESARRIMMAADPHTNLLRTSLAAFAAGVGGADSIAILPFSAAAGLPDAQARRMARNLHHLMLEESNLHRVTDPVAGSGAIEALTEGMCEAAWTEFQTIEREGGILKSLSSGALQGRIAASRSALERAIADGSEVFVGATVFPSASRADASVLEAEPWPNPAFRDVVLQCEPLVPMRLPDEAPTS